MECEEHFERESEICRLSRRSEIKKSNKYAIKIANRTFDHFLVEINNC